MADKVVINLATGLEDPERVTVAFLVGRRGGRAGQAGRDVPHEGGGPPWAPGLRRTGGDGCPPLSRLFQQYADGGGELLVCPICFNARKLDEGRLTGNARLAGATPLWEFAGAGEIGPDAPGSRASTLSTAY